MKIWILVIVFTHMSGRETTVEVMPFDKAEICLSARDIIKTDPDLNKKYKKIDTACVVRDVR